MKKTLQKTKIVAQVVSVLIIVVVLFFSTKDVVIAKKVTCSSFASQKQAQVTFDSDRVRYRRLDGGKHDGKACNSYHYK